MSAQHSSISSVPSSSILQLGSSNPPSCPTVPSPVARVAPEQRGLLVVTSGELAGQVLAFPVPGQSLTLGRSPESAIPFRALSLSRQHARLLRIGDDHLITDAGSTNGTFINGIRIEHATRLNHGDQVRLGADITLRFSLVDPEEAVGLVVAGEACGRDLLTGAWTRSHMEAALETELPRALREGLPLSVMMIDVDRFKAVNDTHGHLAGDEILAGLGRVMRDSIRHTDILARYGGEEFVVVAPGTRLEKAHAVAERIRRAVAGTRFCWASKSIRVTISIGVACLDCCEGEPDALSLLRLADERVYLAKRTRNAVVSGGAGGVRLRDRRSGDPGR